VKTILRLFGLTLMLSGWAIAAMCLHIVRTPNPNDPSSSKLVVIPKARLGISQTYVDARSWTMADVPAHAALISRMLDAGKAEQLQFLADPKCKLDIAAQLTDALAGAKGTTAGHTSARANVKFGQPTGSDEGRELGVNISF
jgi:hypothetical protein